MATYPPPSETLPIFDAGVFTTNETNLTISQADKRYLKFPTGQGTETLPALVVAGTINNLELKVNSSNYSVSVGQIPMIPISATGLYNFAFGSNTLPVLSSGENNLAMGAFSGIGITTGSKNTAVGNNSLRGGNVSACTAIGANTLYNVTGSNNVAIGSDSANALTSGTNNTIIGTSANVSGNPINCTTIGTEATCNSISQGTALGYLSAVSANNATALGHATIASGANSTAIGHNANTGGHARSTAIGYNSTATAVDQIRLGNTSTNVSIPGSLSWAQSAFISCSSINVINLVNSTQTFTWTSSAGSLLGFSAVSANSTITIPYTGYYLMTFSTNTAAAGAVNSVCSFTATTTPETYVILRAGFPGVSSFTQALTGTRMIKFTIGDTIVMTGINSNTGTIVLSDTNLQVVRLF